MAVAIPQAQAMWQTAQLEGSIWDHPQYASLQQGYAVESSALWWPGSMGDSPTSVESSPLGAWTASAPGCQAAPAMDFSWLAASPQGLKAPPGFDGKLGSLLGQAMDLASAKAAAKMSAAFQEKKTPPGSPASSQSTCSGVLDLAAMIPAPGGSEAGSASPCSPGVDKTEPPVMISDDMYEKDGVQSPLEPVLVHETYCGRQLPKRRLPKGQPVKKQLPDWSV